MFEDIHIIYVLSKYKLGLMTRIDLIKSFREYIVSKGQIFIKLLQLLLVNHYKWGNTFTSNEINELNQILDNTYQNIEDSDFQVGCGSVAYVSYERKNNIANKDIVIKRLLPNINEEIKLSFDRFKNMINIASYFNYDFISIENLDSYYDFIVEQTDLNKEVSNMIKIKNIYKNCSNIDVPYVYAYNHEMIKMSFVKGEKLSVFLSKYLYLKTETLELLKQALLLMIDNNIIHSDLHEGNLLFYQDDEEVFLNIIDYGLVINLDEKSKNILKSYLFNNTFKSSIDFYYYTIISDVSYNDFYNLLEKNKYIFKKGEAINLINLLKENDIYIDTKYLNMIISISALRLRLKNLN